MKLIALLSSLIAVEAHWWQPHQAPQEHGQNIHDSQSLAKPSSKAFQSAAVKADCHEDNCLRAMIREGGDGATPFCQQFTTAIITAQASLPTYASMCTPDAVSGISSACSCLVKGLSTTTPTSQQTVVASASDSTQPGSSTSIQSTLNVPTSNLSAAVASPTYQPRPGCNEDNCLRAVIREGGINATTFCQEFTTAVITDTLALPTYASMCTPDPISGVSSACSCYVPSAERAAFSTTTTTLTLAAATTLEITVTVDGLGNIESSTLNASVSTPLPSASPVSTDAEISGTEMLTLTTLTPFPSLSPTAIQNTSALAIPTGGPVSPIIATCPNPATCQASAACSPDRLCLCQPSIDGIGYCLADTPCSKLRNCTTNADCGDGSACMITCCSNHKCLDVPFLCPNPGTPARLFANRNFGNWDVPSTNGWGRTGRKTTINRTTTPGPAAAALNCQKDNCLRELEDYRFIASAYTFCQTYTTTVNAEPTAIPTYLENCNASPNAVSSACSCLVASITQNAPKSTATTLDCQPDNCLREVHDSRFSSSALGFCATYTTTVNTDPTAIPTYLENCAGNPSAVSSACSCLASPTAISSTTSTTSTTSSTTFSSPAATPTLDCQADNCLRELEDRRFNALAVRFCATYTTAIIAEPSAIPAYLENCEGSPRAVSSACSCIMAIATGV